MTETKDINVKLRLEQSLYEELRKLAKLGERSVSGEMRVALRRYVRERTAGE